VTSTSTTTAFQTNVQTATVTSYVAINITQTQTIPVTSTNVVYATQTSLSVVDITQTQTSLATTVLPVTSYITSLTTTVVPVAKTTTLLSTVIISSTSTSIIPYTTVVTSFSTTVMPVTSTTVKSITSTFITTTVSRLQSERSAQLTTYTRQPQTLIPRRRIPSLTRPQPRQSKFSSLRPLSLQQHRLAVFPHRRQILRQRTLLPTIAVSRESGIPIMTISTTIIPLLLVPTAVLRFVSSMIAHKVFDLKHC